MVDPCDNYSRGRLASYREHCGVEGVLTAGEDEWAGVLVHWKVVQLQLAFCVYC